MAGAGRPDWPDAVEPPEPAWLALPGTGSAVAELGAPRQQPEVVGLVPAVLAQQPAAAVRQAEARAAQRAQRVPQEPQVRPVAVALAV